MRQNLYKESPSKTDKPTRRKDFVPFNSGISGTDVSDPYPRHNQSVHQHNQIPPGSYLRDHYNYSHSQRNAGISPGIVKKGGISHKVQKQIKNKNLELFRVKEGFKEEEGSINTINNTIESMKLNLYMFHHKLKDLSNIQITEPKPREGLTKKTFQMKEEDPIVGSIKIVKKVKSPVYHTKGAESSGMGSTTEDTPNKILPKRMTKIVKLSPTNKEELKTIPTSTKNSPQNILTPTLHQTEDESNLLQKTETKQTHEVNIGTDDHERETGNEEAEVQEVVEEVQEENKQNKEKSQKSDHKQNTKEYSEAENQKEKEVKIKEKSRIVSDSETKSIPPLERKPTGNGRTSISSIRNSNQTPQPPSSIPNKHNEQSKNSLHRKKESISNLRIKQNHSTKGKAKPIKIYEGFIIKNKFYCLFNKARLAQIRVLYNQRLEMTKVIKNQLSSLYQKALLSSRTNPDPLEEEEEELRKSDHQSVANQDPTNEEIEKREEDQHINEDNLVNKKNEKENEVEKQNENEEEPVEEQNQLSDEKVVVKDNEEIRRTYCEWFNKTILTQIRLLAKEKNELTIFIKNHLSMLYQKLLQNNTQLP
jgi:hypothetical protein